MTAYSIAYGREKDHAAELVAGLALLTPEFSAQVCLWCAGEGRSRQMFTAGCGGGYYHAMSGCDHCAGTGLVEKSSRRAASLSVREQVLVAGRHSLGCAA